MVVTFMVIFILRTCVLLAQKRPLEDRSGTRAPRVSETSVATCRSTNNMEQRPSLEANRFLAAQKIPHILYNLRLS
jgi:hypothetical protein